MYSSAVEFVVAASARGTGTTALQTVRIILSFFTSRTALLFGLYVPGLQTVFQLMGSTSSAFVCFVLPAAFEIKLWRLRMANAGSASERDVAAPSTCHPFRSTSSAWARAARSCCTSAAGCSPR